MVHPRYRDPAEAFIKNVLCRSKSDKMISFDHLEVKHYARQNEIFLYWKGNLSGNRL